MGSGFDPAFSDGRMNYQQAVDWTNNLNIAGVTGWRLPTTQQPDYSCDRRSNSGNYYFGSNCRSSEMGNLFYNVLGSTPSSSIITNHNLNFDFFSNIQEAFYWSLTDQPGFEQNSIGFYFNSGYQRDNNKAMPNYAWAVRSGDVSAVPVPAALWLFVSGLIGLTGFSRFKRKL